MRRARAERDERRKRGECNEGMRGAETAELFSNLKFNCKIDQLHQLIINQSKEQWLAPAIAAAEITE